MFRLRLWNMVACLRSAIRSSSGRTKARRDIKNVGLKMENHSGRDRQDGSGLREPSCNTNCQPQEKDIAVVLEVGVALVRAQIASLKSDILHLNHQDCSSIRAIRDHLVQVGLAMDRLSVQVSTDIPGLAPVASRVLRVTTEADLVSKLILVASCAAAEQHDLQARLEAEKLADTVGMVRSSIEAAASSARRTISTSCDTG